MKEVVEWFTIDLVSAILMFVFVEYAELFVKWVGILALAFYNIAKGYSALKSRNNDKK